MFDRLIVGDTKRFLIQLTRIADALEVLAGTYKTPEEIKAEQKQKLELLEDITEETTKAEIEEKQELVTKELEKNSGNFLWAEDNVDSEKLEDIQ